MINTRRDLARIILWLDRRQCACITCIFLLILWSDCFQCACNVGFFLLMLRLDRCQWACIIIICQWILWLKMTFPDGQHANLGSPILPPIPPPRALRHFLAIFLVFSLSSPNGQQTPPHTFLAQIRELSAIFSTRECQPRWISSWHFWPTKQRQINDKFQPSFGLEPSEMDKTKYHKAQMEHALFVATIFMARTCQKDG